MRQLEKYLNIYTYTIFLGILRDLLVLGQTVESYESNLNFTHSLWLHHAMSDVALLKYMPSSSVLRCPSPGCANVGGYVVSQSSLLSSFPSHPCSWLPFCQTLCPSVIIRSYYVSYPAPFEI